MRNFLLFKINIFIMFAVGAEGLVYVTFDNPEAAQM
jgi:hypothetical protein